MNVNGQASSIDVFEELWSEFEQQYAGFEIRGIDWDKLYDTYRLQINEHSDPENLFEVCCELLQELQDSHVNLIDKTGSQVNRCNSNDFPNSTSILREYSEYDFYNIVDGTLYSNGFAPLKKRQVIEYSKSDSIGYIRISKMSENSKGLNQALDELRDTKGIILDIRLNPGGNDQYLYQIAGRFADKKRIGHYKKDRIKGTNNFSKAKAWHLKPNGKYQYNKPILILTSDFTASAAEIFVLAMKELPYVRTIGGVTNGATSHMKPIKLSNGWVVTLSNQIAYSAKMKNYEGKGIEPDIVLKNNVEGDTDVVLVRAINELNKAQITSSKNP
ncbi:S41 family peptidase [Reichenbachiella ulvae]|uniref:S41 family peptidase n=1 Tax=Reichenbachiella ulvae TaxID=2980104 RepID=A0ABT3CV10_9BACT|nr:S41 family peptidase [Reichenbachiella ulvae]MCV9387315.1 S41 family peptidase [Reichenbachiella ulvae]